MDGIKLILLYLSFGLSFFLVRGQQIGNYVSNGSFETLNFPYANYKGATYWESLDTNGFGYHIFTTSPSFSIMMAPYCPSGFQYPLTGSNLLLTTFYCDTQTCGYDARGYPRNRLKQPLKANQTYCVKFHVVVVNNSTYGIDAIGAYFGDSTLDTVKYCSIPLTYLSPQIENPTGNIITDTLNWIAVTGTFVASGTEKYMVIGNFKSFDNTNATMINPSQLPDVWTDLYVDDVSCVELNLPAYAGPDVSIDLGDSVFIGREPDWAIDSGCIWYKIPNMTTSLDTVSGFWVKPTSTSTYVVRQQLDCSAVKWDTVLVSIKIDDTALNGLSRLSDNIRLAPNPTNGHLRISFIGSTLAEISSFFITNNLGQVVRHEGLDYNGISADIDTSDLEPGLYQIHFRTSLQTVSKKFVRTD
jgi:hypothetical protein